MERGIILVEYIPDFCCTCDYASNEICRINERDIDVDPYTDRPDWCPIKIAPQRANHENYCDGGRYDKGFNDCLDEIFGREK